MHDKTERFTGTLASSKRILITGASRGIGRCTAELLARAGHRVVLAARDEVALRQVAAEITRQGGQAEVLVMDVCDDASVTRAMAALLATGPVDVAVNNAGVCEQGEFMCLAPDTMRAELELNYLGATRVARALLPAWIERGEGLLVNVSSLLGSVASPTTANYGATKAALESWSHALRAELQRFGVRVSVFVVPHTDTDMGRRVHFEGVFSLPVDYTARELLRAIDRAPRRYAGSPVYRALLWLARLFPAFMEARVGATARTSLRLAAGQARAPFAKRSDAPAAVGANGA
ncbi:MAG TPA: SDR family NAD(P)-dependent oxidoreductase [Polyangiales bacterium]